MKSGTYLTIKAIADSENYINKFEKDGSLKEILLAFSRALSVCGWECFVSTETKDSFSLTAYINKEGE